MIEPALLVYIGLPKPFLAILWDHASFLLNLKEATVSPTPDKLEFSLLLVLRGEHNEASIYTEIIYATRTSIKFKRTCTPVKRMVPICGPSFLFNYTSKN